jgi:hypothetical protein
MSNKMKILTIILALICFSTTYNVTAVKEESTNEPVLQVGVFGASLLGLRHTGFFINNNGDEQINNINYTFEVKSNSNDSMSFVYSDDIDSLKVNSVFLITFPNQDSHLGLVTLSLTVNSSNAGEATETINGFQIGSFILAKTYVLSWF